MTLLQQLNNLPQILLEQLKHIHGEEYVETLSFESILNNIINYYENIIGCMPGNVYWFNKEGIAVGCNKNVLAMFGLKSITEFKGLTFEDMGRVAHWTPSATQSFKRDTLEVISTGKAKLNIEEPPIPHSDGKLIYFLTNRVPLFDNKHNVIGIVGISFDITERKKMEESLLKAKEAAEAADKAKTEFLMNMRHDIRTPLTGIIGFANLIKEEAKNQKINEYADNMLASSLALLEFLNEILEAIRVTSGETPLLKKKFNLEDKLQSIVSLNQPKATQKNLVLTLDYDKNLPHYLLGDAKRLHRIVLELVSNALNFTHEGEIKISASLAQKQDRDITVRILVSDTGIGIHPNKLEDIFIRFIKLNPSYEGIYKGIGIGLTIVKQFIDDLDGEIYVDSEVNKGSTFTCIVRFKEALLDEAFGADNAPETPLISSTLNINNRPIALQVGAFEQSEASVVRLLLVEDQPIAAAAAKALLNKLNCKIDLAKDGKSALIQAKTQDYDLIFMDVGLPDITGNEVTREIRAWEISSDKHIPIVGLTAHVDTEEKQICIESGMDAVLTKPLLKETAIDILTAFIPRYVEKNSASRNEQQSTSRLETKNDQHLLVISGEIIDLELGAKLVNADISVAKDMLDMFVTSFPEEIEKLEDAHKKDDWKAIKAIAHKMRGGAAYCGTVRLTEACNNLQNYIKSGKTTLLKALYEQMINEIESVKIKFNSLI